jgi:selenide,water dikinase
MTTLNRAASEAMLAVGVSAATDVTGFGLLGHLHAMLRASSAGATIQATSVPLLPAALELAVQRFAPPAAPATSKTWPPTSTGTTTSIPPAAS